jgi:ubiquinone/menaquinone biosynthesis C-methylase UbiE
MDCADWKREDKEYHRSQRVVDSYERRIASKYLLEYKHYTMDKWVDMLSGRSARKVLDVGCGPGICAVKLLRAHMEVVALDYSEPMLHALRARTPNAKGLSLVCGDGERMPFKDAAFDAVICAGILLHVADAPALIEEVCRVTAPGGTVCIAVSYPYHSLLRAIKRLRSLIRWEDELSTATKIVSRQEFDAIRGILLRYAFTYTEQYLSYWPLLCRVLPEWSAYPLVQFLNACNPSKRRGDTIIITARKETAR